MIFENTQEAISILKYENSSDSNFYQATYYLINEHDWTVEDILEAIKDPESNAK